MALYIGNQKVCPYSSEQIWWGDANAEFLYEANYNCSLSETADWPTYKDTWSTSARIIKFPATEYTSSANANVVYDRWGSGTNTGGDATLKLDFSKYNYFILQDALINMAYTSPEATLGLMHVVRSCRTALIPIGQVIRMASGQIVYPSETNAGTPGHFTISFHRQLLRNASNVLSLTDSANYGLYFTAIAPTHASTSAALQCNYINFRTPSLAIRGNNSYLVQGAFEAIDGDNTQIKIRQRLYRVKKSGYCESAYSRLGHILETGILPTELI